jgi:hypothetical protein
MQRSKFIPLFLALFALPAAASAQPAPGTELRGLMRNTIDTKTAYVGQEVYVDDVASSNGRIQNATLRGTVRNVVRASQGRPAKLMLRFTTLTLRNGTVYRIDGTATGVNARTKNNALKEAGGAVAGMLVGNAIFKTLFQSSAGGLLGAAGGFLVAKNNRENMSIAAGSVVVVTISSSRRQS